MTAVDAPSRPRPRPRPALACGLVAAAATLAAHGLSLLAGFAWDDQHTVLSNPALQSPSGLLRALVADDWSLYGLGARGLYRPLATLSLALDHALFGFRATGFHLTSLTLHGFASFALMRTLAAAGIRPTIALLSGALFAVHPLGAEVADWISARPDGLSAALAIAALWTAMRDRPLLAAGLAAAAPFAKEPGVMALPAVLLVVGARSTRHRLWQAGAVSVLGLSAYLVARWLAVPDGGLPGLALDGRSLVAAVGRLGEVVAGGVDAFLFPLPLNLTRRNPDLGAWRWAVTVVVLGGSAAVLALAARHGPTLAVPLLALGMGPLLLLAGWAPNLSERYLYLPSLAAVLSLGLAAERLAARLGQMNPRVARLGVGLLALVLAAASWASASRAREWGNPIALFGSAVVADPGNAEAWRLLGAERYRRADRSGALDAFERAARLGSAHAGLYSNLCAVRREVGDLAGSQAACERAVALDPNDPRPRYNRALLHAAQGRAGEALQELRRLTADHPGYRPAREALRAMEGAGH